MIGKAITPPFATSSESANRSGVGDERAPETDERLIYEAALQMAEGQSSMDRVLEQGQCNAKDIFATPVSTGGRVLETYRSSLKPEMAEALICTQNWLNPSFTFFKDKNLMEDFELSEDIITEFEEIPSAVRGGSSQCQPQPSGCG